MTTPFSMIAPEHGPAPASYADWLAQVQKDLKDPNAYEGLRWASPEGFTVDPYYTAEQMESLDLAALQQAQKTIPGWLNAPEYIAKAGQEKELNTTLRDALANGADALLLTIASVSTPGVDTLSRLLDGIKLSNTPIFFRLEAGDDGPSFLQTLRQVAPYQLRGGLLPTSGVLPAALLADLLGQGSESPNFRPIGINSHDFHRAGGTATQELAFMLARLTQTYADLVEAGLTPVQLVPKTMLSVSVGTSYFMEMAKLRALRVLLTRLGLTTPGHPMLIHGQTSTFYEAAATPYTNLLRATTEAMAAVIGGADVLTVRPYDAMLGTSTEFSERIARNVSTLLKTESYLDKVADPAAGSYYIETLTHQLTESAWALFQQVEAMGGFSKAMDSGYIEQELDKAYQEKVEAITNGRVLVGVTRFRHDEAGEAKAVQSEGDLIGLKNRRLAEPFE